MPWAKRADGTWGNLEPPVQSDGATVSEAMVLETRLDAVSMPASQVTTKSNGGPASDVKSSVAAMAAQFQVPIGIAKAAPPRPLSRKFSPPGIPTTAERFSAPPQEVEDEPVPSKLVKEPPPRPSRMPKTVLPPSIDTSTSPAGLQKIPLDGPKPKPQRPSRPLKDPSLVPTLSGSELEAGKDELAPVAPRLAEIRQARSAPAATPVPSIIRGPAEEAPGVTGPPAVPKRLPTVSTIVTNTVPTPRKPPPPPVPARPILISSNSSPEPSVRPPIPIRQSQGPPVVHAHDESLINDASLVSSAPAVPISNFVHTSHHPPPPTRARSSHASSSTSSMPTSTNEKKGFARGKAEEFARNRRNCLDPPPACFSRPPPPESAQTDEGILVTYAPLPNIILLRSPNSNDLAKALSTGRAFPLMPHSLPSHDVHRSDWERLWEDIDETARIELRQSAGLSVATLPLMPVFGAGLAVSTLAERKLRALRVEPTCKLVEQWNLNFFRPRGLDVYIAQSNFRLSGPCPTAESRKVYDPAYVRIQEATTDAEKAKAIKDYEKVDGKFRFVVQSYP